jgi:hypothetical protein
MRHNVHGVLCTTPKVWVEVINGFSDAVAYLLEMPLVNEDVTYSLRNAGKERGTYVSVQPATRGRESSTDHPVKVVESFAYEPANVESAHLRIAHLYASPFGVDGFVGDCPPDRDTDGAQKFHIID